MADAMLYAYGFDGTREAVEAEVAAIGPLAYDVVIAAFMHIHEGGRLYLNDTPVEDLCEGWAGLIADLKSGFHTKKRVLVSIGGADNEDDWMYLAQDLPRVVKNLVDFAKANNIDGIDLDFEGGPDGWGENSAKAVGTAARLFKQAMPRGLVTAPPYMNLEDFWNTVLAVAANHGASPFDWWNVQFYEGESDIDPGEYVSTFEEWTAIVGSEGSGVGDPDSFVAPGCNGLPDTKFSTQNFEAGLSSVRAKHPQVRGGFVWEYTGLAAPAVWANAVHRALG